MNKNFLFIPVFLILSTSLAYAETFTWYLGNNSQRGFHYNEYKKIIKFYPYTPSYSTLIDFSTSSRANRCENWVQLKLYLYGNQVYEGPEIRSTDDSKRHSLRIPSLYSNNLSVKKIRGDNDYTDSFGRDHDCWLQVNGNVYSISDPVFKGQSSVFIEDEAKDFGTVDSIAGTDLNSLGVTSVRVGSGNSKVKVWVGSAQDYNNDKTTDFTGTVYACLDSDENNACDFVEGNECSDDGGDWYNGACCGGQAGGSYKSVNTCTYLGESSVADCDDKKNVCRLTVCTDSRYNPSSGKCEKDPIYNEATGNYDKCEAGYTLNPTTNMCQGEPEITDPENTCSSLGGEIKNTGSGAQCVYASIQAICSQLSDNSWQWIPLKSDVGRVYDTSCPGGNFVSNGTEYSYCGSAQVIPGNPPYSTFTFKNINFHEYYCDKNNNQILECAGRSAPYSDVNNRQTGASFSGSSYLSCIPGVVSYWSFDNENAEDSFGLNDGTATGVVFVNGKKGNASSFDGNAKLTVPNAASLADPGDELSIEMWFNPADTTDTRMLVDKQDSYRILTQNGVLKAALKTERTDWSLVGTANVQKDSWYHAVLTYNARAQGDNLKLYINGALAGSRRQEGKVNASIFDLIIGYRESPRQPFKGLIDEAAIYNKALPVSDIQAHYNGADLCTTISGQGTYYCASDGDWTQDLDIKDEDSCNLSGFSWTGSRCCNEPEDSDEFYNDADKDAEKFAGKVVVKSQNASVTDYMIQMSGNDFVTLRGPLNLRVVAKSEILEFGQYTECDVALDVNEIIREGEQKTFANTEPSPPFPQDSGCTLRNTYIYSEPILAKGGCWNKTFVSTGEFLVIDGITNYGVLNYRGQFSGCNVTNQSLLSVNDIFSQAQLINNYRPCGIPLINATQSTHSVCQPKGVWTFTQNEGATILKRIKWDITDVNISIIESGCCASTECWNGTGCQPLGTIYRAGEKGFGCRMA